MKRLFKQFSFPLGNSESRRAGDAGLDSRRRRARLRAVARVRRRLRQPRTARRLRGGRRRGRDRAARDELALEQVPQPRHRRGRPPDPSPERLQDREPDRAGPYQPRRARIACSAATATRRTMSRATIPPRCIVKMATTLDTVIADIRGIQTRARTGGTVERPRWPMIVLRSPKGLDRPQGGRRKKDRGFLALPSGPTGRNARTPRARRAARAVDEELSAGGALRLDGPAPVRSRRARTARASDEWAPTRTPTAACCSTTSTLPDFRPYAVDVPQPGATDAEATRVMGQFLRDVLKTNLASRNFRLFSPDENNSNRWQDVFEVTDRTWNAERLSVRRSSRARRPRDGDALASISARDGWRATCSPAVTVSFPATRRSSTSSTRCSTSTRNG